MLQDSIYYTLAQINPGITDWLFKQAPVVVILGVIIWWLADRLKKVEAEKSVLAENVIKLSTLYQAKDDKNDLANKEISDQLTVIINLIKYGNNH